MNFLSRRGRRAVAVYVWPRLYAISIQILAKIACRGGVEVAGWTADQKIRVRFLWGAVWLFIQHFLISKIRFRDIKKWILHIKKYFWYQELFLISRIIFLIPRIRFLDIKNSFLDIKNSFLDIKKIIIFLDIKKSISWHQEMISWYQDFDFLISGNVYYFVILRTRILDIKKCISWYQEMYFLISRNNE